MTVATRRPKVAEAPRSPGVPIDPRIRERRAEVLRRQAKRRLRVAVSLLGVAAAGTGAWFLLHTSVFSARVVTVDGALHTPRSQILEAAGLADHPPLIDVNGAAAAARLEQLPWVASATVARQWPDGVRVTVVERTPVAAVALHAPASGWALLDRSGRVLGDMAHLPADTVQVAGTAAPGPPGSTLSSAEDAVKVVAALPAALRAQVAGVTEAQGGTLTLQLTSPLTVDLGSTVDLNQKFEDVAAILSGASLAAGDVIDVSVPGAPAVSG